MNVKTKQRKLGRNKEGARANDLIQHGEGTEQEGKSKKGTGKSKQFSVFSSKLKT
ncbi:MAG: hypothetical protein H0W76_25500 [Pyrinomonadaceae bacterium]|nr:hypothetical protein [Pyrinomonadaceae bacterium]